MKIILTVLFAGALCVVAADAQEKTYSERDSLFGPVRSVTAEVAEFTTKDGKNIEGPRMPVQTTTYDARGNRLKRVDYNHDGSVAQTLVYTYDAEGRGTGYEDYTPGLSTARKHVYVLDANGNRVEYKIIQPTGSAADEKYLYKYDANGNKIAEELYHKTSLISRNENAYDTQGRLISQTIYNPDGSISSRVQNAISADGKPTERTRYDGDLLTYKVRYAYDKKGKLEELETTGSYVSDASMEEGHITGKLVYIYKGKDQPKETLVFNPDGSLREKVVVEYDSHGNWTRRTHRVRSAQSGKELTLQIEYRTITYH
jgi:antitoxin component YwqK of YwqJK toxin-antitoxin module